MERGGIMIQSIRQYKKRSKITFNDYNTPLIVNTYSGTLNKIAPAIVGISASNTYCGAGANDSYIVYYGGTTAAVTADAWDKNFTRTVINNVTGVYLPKGVFTSSKAILAGGNTSNNASVFVSFDESLTRVLVTDNSSVLRECSGGVTGEYCIFGGGNNGSTDQIKSRAIDSNLTVTQLTDLSMARRYLTGTDIGDYVLIAGGSSGSTYYANVDTYNSELTKGMATDLSHAKRIFAGARNSKYALFGGGGSYSEVDAYDTNLTKTSAPEMFAKVYGVTGANNKGYATFAGGLVSGVFYNNVDAWDNELVKTSLPDLSSKRYKATGIGDYERIMFIGGATSTSNPVVTVDGYRQALAPIEVLPSTHGSEYNIGNGKKIADNEYIEVTNPVTGYISLESSSF